MSVIIGGKRGEIIMSVLAIIALLGLAFLSISYPTDEYFIENDMPIPEYDVQDLFIALTALSIVIMSWESCGCDHKENVNKDHPDGRLTYPGEQT